MRKCILFVVLVLVGTWGATPAFAVGVGFDDVIYHCYSLGPISPPGGPTQAGWSGGA